MKKLLFISFISFSLWAQAQLSGVYTIGGSSPDFTSIQGACDSLKHTGISGPVTFNIRNGVYNESVILDSVLGTSPVNTITFRSENGDSSLVHIVGSTGITFYSATDFLRFSDISFQNDSNFTLIQLDSVSDVAFNNCGIVADTVSGGSGLVINNSYSGLHKLELGNCRICTNGPACQINGGNVIENFSIDRSYFRCNAPPVYLTTSSGTLNNVSVTRSEIHSQAPPVYTNGILTIINFLTDSCRIYTQAPFLYFSSPDSIYNLKIRNSIINTANNPPIIISTARRISNMQIEDNNFLCDNVSLVINATGLVDSVTISHNMVLSNTGAPFFVGNIFQANAINISNNNIRSGGGINLYSSGGKYTNFTVRNNLFKITSSSMGIYLSCDSLMKFNISRNTFDTVAGHTYLNGIYLSSNNSIDVFLDSNSINQFYSIGIGVAEGKNIYLRGNIINCNPTSLGLGINLYNIKDSTVWISENHINLNQGYGYAINIAGSSSSATNHFVIANNALTNCGPCIYVLPNNPVDIIHNSFAANKNGPLIYLNSQAPASLTILNNIINVDSVNFTGSIYSTYNYTTINKMRNNVYNFDTTRSNLMNGFNSVYSLNQNTGLDSGSFYKTVSFVNTPFDLHVNCTETYLNAGYPTSITKDIDGWSRSSVPTIGADEILSAANTLETGTVSICGDSVTLTAGFSPASTYSWNTGANGPTIVADTAGVYVVTVNTACGALSDTTRVNYTTITTASASVNQVFLTSEFSNTSINANTYYWYFGDGDTSSLASPTHTFATPGTYTVTLIAFGNCVNDTLVFEVYPVSNISVSEAGNEPGFIAAPNPSTGTFALNAKKLNNTSVKVSITDLQGRTIFNRVFESLKGDQNIPIDISGSPTGVYILHVRTDDRVFTSRIIKN